MLKRFSLTIHVDPMLTNMPISESWTSHGCHCSVAKLPDLRPWLSFLISTYSSQSNYWELIAYHSMD